MANPQIEDGFIMISREVTLALCRFRIPGEARQVFDFILAKTWGWKKKSDAIALSQFVLGTGLSKKTIIKQRKKLLELNLIVTQLGDASCTTYSINKDFDTWKSSPKKVTSPKKATGVTQKGDESSPKKPPTKEESKETTTKEKTPLPPCRGAVERIFESWKAERGRPEAVLDRHRRRAIGARLRDQIPEETILMAVKGIARSPHHMGKNDAGIVWDEISRICDNAASVEHLARLEMQARQKLVIARARSDPHPTPEPTPEELERSRIAREESSRRLAEKWGPNWKS